MGGVRGENPVISESLDDSDGLPPVQQGRRRWEWLLVEVFAGRLY